jgi:hypothetical protein
MPNLNKKIVTTGIIFLFCLSGLTFTTSGEQTVLPISTERTDVIYRCGPDGSITPVQILIKPGETREDALFNACVERATQDTGLLKYFTDLGIEQSKVSFIKSKGRGILIDMKIYLPMKRVLKKYPNLPPFYRLIKIHDITARYNRDLRATTYIQPFSGNTSTILGPNQVKATMFIGYTTWIGTYAKRGLLLRCGFAGYALLTESSQ